MELTVAPFQSFRYRSGPGCVPVVLRSSVVQVVKLTADGTVCPEYNNWHMLHSRECFATANVCQKVVKENKNVSGSVTVTVYFFKFIIQGLARTQTPTLINCVPELPTFGVIAGVSPVEVQWKGLLLGEPPGWSRYLLYQVSMIWRRTPRHLKRPHFK